MTVGALMLALAGVLGIAAAGEEAEERARKRRRTRRRELEDRRKR